MYKDYYNLKENPFNITADPDFYFSSWRHAEAYSHLVYGIQQRKGILVLTGEIGTGKTTLCRTFLSGLDEKTRSALILNPNLSTVQMLQFIVKDFGVEAKGKTKIELMNALNEFLLEESGKGHNVVLIIDEAQNLDIKQLEQIRLLSNLETEKEKLLQIILIGQPELIEKLKLPDLRQLNQRITVRFHIDSIDKEEVEAYINHRLKIASQNGSSKVKFSKAALDAIYEYSQGTPRMINAISDRALLSGFVSETDEINEDMIHKCAEEVVK